jgi:hypothetical protein
MSSPSKRFYLTKKDTVIIFENNLVDVTTEDGTLYHELEPRRLFPVSRANSYITLLDTSGVEVAVIKDISDLSDSSREVIEYSLNDYYLVPHILKIYSVTEKNGKIHWSIETERGYKEFDVKNRNHDVRVYSDGRVRVRDSDDNRYIITDYRKLDKHSRQQMIADL